MKRLAVVFIVTSLLSASGLANDTYKAGSSYAQRIKDQGMSMISSMNPVETIPNFDATPPESSRYGDVIGTSNNMDNDGNLALHESVVGKTITDSILKNPKEPISNDAPFISAGFDAQENAGSVTDGSFSGCQTTLKKQTHITNHVCERDVNATQTCKRSAFITAKVLTEHYMTTLVLDAKTARGRRAENYWIQLDFVVPEDGTIGMTGSTWEFLYPATPDWHGDRLDYSVQAFGQVIRTHINYSGNLNISMQDLVKGQIATVRIRYNTDGHHDLAANALIRNLASGRFVLRISLPMLATRDRLVPVIQWSEPCTLSKEYGVVMVGSVCSVKGGNRDVVIDGAPFNVHSDCWEKTDSYRIQEASEGNCGAYTSNSLCTLASRACSFSDNGLCLHENVIYTCETHVETEGMMCGEQFFCADGSCAQSAAGLSDSFHKTISQLAAVSAAGEDVAKMNDINVKAFTGQALSCRKATAGFNDCCKSSGWGNGVGLAHCSSEEKALGEARERQLTVEVGEYCSRKVLGVCLQKKRGFCAFESKLAQIVQQQGRHWQLGISFGSGENPKCRAITIEELQGINFSQLDFNNFYDDLQNGTEIPSDNALIEKAKALINDRQQEAGR